MHPLVLHLLINHLADIITTLEEQMEKAYHSPHSGNFTRIQKSPMSEEFTFKEVLPLYGIMQTLQKGLPFVELDTGGETEV